MSRAEFLRKQYLERKRRNAHYSLRSFARQLEISSGRLSEFLQGKRPVTQAMAEKLADSLGLNLRDRKKFVEGESTARAAGAAPYTPLRADEFSIISDPTHFYLLSLLELSAANPTLEWMAARLGVSSLEVRDCLDRLVRLGLLSRDGEQYLVINSQVTTTHDIPSSALRNSHRKSLEQAIESLQTVPVDLRDISSITMAVDISQLEEAKKLARKFRREMAELLERGNKTEVYNLNIQLVPVTRVEERR